MKTKTFTTKVNYIPNMDVKTIAIDLIYMFKKDLNHTFEIDLIKRLLSTVANGYETDASFTTELLKRLIISYSINIREDGNNMTVRFSLTIPKENLVDDYDIKKAIEFFKNAIFNPLVKDGAFDEERFNLEKEVLYKQYYNSKNSVYNVASRKFMALIDPDELIHRSFEFNLKQLEELTREDVYKYYQENIINNNYLLYIGGCIEEAQANEIYESYFKQEQDSFDMTLDYYDLLSPTGLSYNEDKYDFQQSALFVEFRAEDLKEEDLEYYSLISNILSTPENDLLFKALRIENNLVYSSYTSKMYNSGIFYIETYLKEDNKEKAIEVIKDVLKRLEDRDFMQECIDRLKEGIEMQLIRNLDRKYQELENKINHDLEFRTLDNILESYNKMTVDDALKYLSRIKLNNILFIKGDNND